MNNPEQQMSINQVVQALWEDQESDSSPEKFLGVKLPVVFAHGNREPFPILCYPSKSQPTRTEGDIIPQTGSNFKFKKLNPAFTWSKIVDEPSKDHDFILEDTQNSILKCIKSWSKGGHTTEDDLPDLPTLESKNSDAPEWAFNINDLDYLDQKPLEDRLDVLKGFDYTISYINSRGPRRKKRKIHCKYKGWTRVFDKTWNFIDHARMHLGSKPYKWGHWGAAFTQKGNLKKHLTLHKS